MLSAFKLTGKIVLMNFRSFARFARRYATSLITIMQAALVFCAVYVEPFENDCMMLACALVFVALFLYSKVLQAVANATGCGDSFPVPVKRFTTVDEDGVVSVENDRLQEMILYVADVEDYLERKWQL